MITSIFVLVQVVVLIGVGGSGGEKGKFYAEQSHVLLAYDSQGECQTQAELMNTKKSAGHLFVCVPGFEDHR